METQIAFDKAIIPSHVAKEMAHTTISHLICNKISAAIYDLNGTYGIVKPWTSTYSIAAATGNVVLPIIIRQLVGTIIGRAPVTVDGELLYRSWAHDDPAKKINVKFTMPR